MAKKKVTQQQRTQQTHQEEKKESQNQSTTGTAMEEASEKLENLKNLNNMLLKETIEKRQQVGSLVQTKGYLENELKKSNVENDKLQAELSGEIVKLDVEKVFLSVQVVEVIEKGKKLSSLWSEMSDALRENECEIEGLKKKVKDVDEEIANERTVSEAIRKEKDEMKANLDVKIEEVNGLRVKLVENEKLRAEYYAVLEEIKNKGREIRSVVTEKELFAKRLLDSDKVIEELRGKIDGIVKEKEGIEVERNAQVRKCSELESTVTHLDGMVVSLQREEVKARENLAELEKKCLEGLRKEEEMEKKINELVKGNSEKENRVESLIEEKGVVEKELDKVLKRLDEEKKKIEQMVIEKNEAVQDKVRKEAEIVELHKQVAGFKDAISELGSEVGHYKAAFERVGLEKDEILKCFNDEKQNGINMKKQIEEMEKRIQEIMEVVETAKADYLNVVGEKKELETRYQVLNKEIANVQTSLSEAHKEISAMQCKVELANASYEEMLNALRTAADSICLNGERANGSVLDGNQMNRDNVKSHEFELEAIKKAITRKENKVEEMNRQVESLQFSVAQAQKKKNFWTMLSSATTLFAAISLAYVARGH